MIDLRPLDSADCGIIAAWPPYAGDMAQMDYALRHDGWLTQFFAKPDASFYAVELDGELIGFTCLIRTGEDEEEIRIAIRADKTGLGLGREMMQRTLAQGFTNPCCRRIHLIVRTNNDRGINLYRRLGFVERGTLRKEVNGIETDFIVMDLQRTEYFITQKGGTL